MIYHHSLYVPWSAILAVSIREIIADHSHGPLRSSNPNSHFAAHLTLVYAYYRSNRRDSPANGYPWGLRSRAKSRRGGPNTAHLGNSHVKWTCRTVRTSARCKQCDWLRLRCRCEINAPREINAPGSIALVLRNTSAPAFLFDIAALTHNIYPSTTLLPPPRLQNLGGSIRAIMGQPILGLKGRIETFWSCRPCVVFPSRNVLPMCRWVWSNVAYCTMHASMGSQFTFQTPLLPRSPIPFLLLHPTNLCLSLSLLHWRLYDILQPALLI